MSRSAIVGILAAAQVAVLSALSQMDQDLRQPARPESSLTASPLRSLKTVYRLDPVSPGVLCVSHVGRRHACAALPCLSLCSFFQGHISVCPASALAPPLSTHVRYPYDRDRCSVAAVSTTYGICMIGAVWQQSVPRTICVIVQCGGCRDSICRLGSRVMALCVMCRPAYG